MAARRVVDTSMLQGLVEGASTQEVQKGTPRSTDPNFPVFQTPVNEDIIVYIPRTNMRVDENGEDMLYLSAFTHDGRIGKQFVSLRCISGLAGNPMFDALGYDGTCPACEANQESWELYRVKLQAEARRLGIDPQTDTADTLKPIRENILKEMDLKNAEEYVTFPIVIIPTKGKFLPADDAMDKLQAVYVTWRKKRYQDTLLAALDSMMVNPGHPAGMFWFWKFSYDTQGKQANARDSARNAKYSPIIDAQAVAVFDKFRAKAEDKAKGFTLVKAAEVIVANQFMYKEDIEVEVNKIMARTRQMLDLAKMSNGTPGLVAAGAASPSENPLASFGVSQGNMGVAPSAPAPATDTPANPVSFG